MTFLPLFKKPTIASLMNHAEKKAFKDYLMADQPGPSIVYGEESKIIRNIRAVTASYNLNNVTRTKAYLSFYIKHPEIHWAFLAHMVSRNGGYSMTDLKNSLVSHFLSENERNSLFHFLESANALIFHDAYPQLLLYEESKKSGKSLFRLLPALHVSKFMEPVWAQFYETKQSDLLTLALITNEQQYVEQQLVSKSSDILKSIPYLLQERCGFTNVIFPFKKRGYDQHFSLAGIEIGQFIDPKERISIGKSLYSTLFHPAVFPSAFLFAKTFPHSGSREDYWPNLFASDPRQKIYSPKLTDVWNDVSHKYYLWPDWLKDPEMVSGFDCFDKKKTYRDMTKNVKMDLLKMGSMKLLTKPFLKRGM
ncbi:DUF2515 family protein [Metabacillus sp. SLBN-84]